MTTDNEQQDEGLIRAIGTGSLGINVFNMTVGGGIFVLPGLMASQLGPAAIVAYFICGISVALVFLCYAEIGTRIARSGGSYAYIEDAFGPLAGSVSAILLWFGWAGLADAAITVAMVDTIATAFPILNETLPRAIFMIILFSFLVAVNIRGVKSGVRLYVFNTMVKLVPLMLLLVVGLFVINYENLVISEWPPFENLGTAAVILFFAFGGAETPLNASGEIRNPTKTVPMGLLVGLTGILSIYVGLQTVAQGALGAELPNNTEAPLAAAATVVLGDWGATMLLIGGAFSIYSTVSGDLLNTPRVIFASARDGNLPRFLAKVHPTYHTPYRAIIFFAAVILTFALSGTFKPLAVVASGSILLVYVGVCLAVIRVRRRDGLPAPGNFRLPFGPLVPILSLAFIGWLLSSLTREEALGLVVLVGAAILLHLVMRQLAARTNQN
jgi:amino acid transporter